MKRFLSICSAFAIMLSCVLTTALAAPSQAVAGEVPAYNPDVPAVILLEEEITPRGVVRTFAINIPADGNLHELPEFEGEYIKNTLLTITGTWKPSYGDLEVHFTDETFGGSGYTSLRKSGDSSEFALWATSNWSLSVQARTVAVVGTLQITAG